MLYHCCRHCFKINGMVEGYIYISNIIQSNFWRGISIPPDSRIFATWRCCDHISNYIVVFGGYIYRYICTYLMCMYIHIYIYIYVCVWIGVKLTWCFFDYCVVFKQSIWVCCGAWGMQDALDLHHFCWGKWHQSAKRSSNTCWAVCPTWLGPLGIPGAPSSSWGFLHWIHGKWW